jgi:hypothetical protein
LPVACSPAPQQSAIVINVRYSTDLRASKIKLKSLLKLPLIDLLKPVVIKRTFTKLKGHQFFLKLPFLAKVKEYQTH